MVKRRKKTPKKSKVASTKIRDENGHFLSEEKAIEYLTNKRNAARLLKAHIHHNSKDDDDDDDLLDIHVGNPLQKITKLLEDLKKQKAFSFTLKGSLGIMGVFLTLSIFGVLGGGQILCDKGTQTQIGTIKTLKVLEKDSKGIPYIQNLIDYFRPKVARNTVVLIKSDFTVIKLPFSRLIDLTSYNENVVMATGQYDSCSQKLTVKEANAIEVFQ